MTDTSTLALVPRLDPGLSLIDAMVLGGIAVVLPLTVGGRMRSWAAAAVAAALSFQLTEGPLTAALVLPFVAVAAARVAAAARAGRAAITPLLPATPLVAALFALVAAGGLLVSRRGTTFLGIREPIIELTTVHYSFAGAGALALASAALAQARTPASVRIGAVAVTLSVLAPPVVALGFFVESPWPQVGGAVLMTAAVWCTGALQLGQALGGDRQQAASGRILLGISGVSIAVPMVLAVSWAAANYWDVPALSIPAMARTHGVANALGFTLCGLLARRLQHAPIPTRGADDAPSPPVRRDRPSTAGQLSGRA